MTIFIHDPFYECDGVGDEGPKLSHAAENKFTLLCMSATRVESTIVCEEQLTDPANMSLRFGFEMSQVEKTTICPVAYVEAWFFVTEGIDHHRREHEAEQCWRKNATLFHTVSYGKLVRFFSIVSHMGHHTIMQLLHKLSELLWTAEFRHDSPQTFTSYCVKGLCKIDKRGVEGSMMFLALLLEMASGEHHISGASSLQEAAL
ncbi:hypothetical protein CAPTEDRAFT_199442 [Capitella teleta]|uniref:Uncharacterized protein n=1 Tax=Capitella teleta TaxID=283909 RepID=R7VI28_CAPTE|nr:hypothetical protein CAPTEDRAFT_199442 [Capitella teleta]|eukprot:ELU15365.1 hypothetical protein CAPTEDRAFT_199442 [Capitella teleta]